MAALLTQSCFSFSLSRGPRVPEPDCITGFERSEEGVRALAANESALFWTDTDDKLWRRDHRSGEQEQIGKYRSLYPLLAADDKHVFLATKRERQLFVVPVRGGEPAPFATLPAASPQPAIRELLAARGELFVATDAALLRVDVHGKTTVLLEKRVHALQHTGDKLYFIEGASPELGLALGSWLLRRRGLDQDSANVAEKLKSVQSLAAIDLRTSEQQTLWRGPADASLTAFALDAQHVFVTLSRRERGEVRQKDRGRSELRILNRRFELLRSLALSNEIVEHLALKDGHLFFIDGRALLRTQAKRGPVLMVTRFACDADYLLPGQRLLLAGKGTSACAPFEVPERQVLGQVMARSSVEPTVLHVDARWLYFRERDRIARVPAFGGTRTYLSLPTDLGTIRALNGLGDALFVATDNGLWRLDAKGELRQLEGDTIGDLQRVDDALFAVVGHNLVQLDESGRVQKLFEIGDGVRAFSVRDERVFWIGPREGGTYSERPLLRARLDGSEREVLWSAVHLMDVAAAPGGVYVTRAGYRISGGGGKSLIPPPPKKVELGALEFVSDSGSVQTRFEVGHQPWSIALSPRGIAIDRTGSVVYAKRGSGEPHKLTCDYPDSNFTGLHYANGSFYWAEASGWVLRMPESAIRAQLR